MKIEDITPGVSWACYFKAVDLLEDGRPVTGEPSEHARPGIYEGFGLIKTRDVENSLVEIVDYETQRNYVVNWNDCWGVDEVEWREAD